MRTHAWIVSVVIATLFVACSPQRRQQAEMTVRTADSLRAAGQYYNDSAALAEAVSTLRPVRLFHPNSYAHACYHYGRMLIDANSPVIAMEQLLRAEQYAGTDYILRGRILTNIAYICQLEERWPLAYDIYQESGNCFLQGEDTIAYYIALHSMAKMSAYIPSYDSTFVLIDSIRSNCPDSLIRIQAFVPAMQYYIRHKDYELAIQYADTLIKYKTLYSFACLTKAQAYHYLNQKDSACWYAEQVIAVDPILLNLRNAYYILANDDVNADKELIKQRASTRADIQREMQHRQAELTRTVELMLHRQQMQRHRKIVLFIGIAAIIALLLIALLLFFRRRKHKKDIITLHKKNKSLQQTNQSLQQTNRDLLSEQEEQYRQIQSDIESTCQTLLANPNWMKVMQWDDYKSLCRNINVRFYRLEERLQAINSMKEQEVRLCVLVLMNLSHKEIAGILRCSHTSIGRFKENTAQKLGVHGGELRMRLLELLDAK